MAELDLKPARRQRLADVLYGQILKQLTTGALREGDQLPPESEISRTFGVSRPVVRQALQRLRADGLVVARRGSGTFVKSRPPRTSGSAPATDAELAQYRHTFELRLALETEAARLAATRHKPADLVRLKRALNDLKKCFDKGTHGENEDFAFHLALAEASQNPLFLTVLKGVHKDVIRSMKMGPGITLLGSASRRQQIIREHQQILEAVAARDSDLAELYVRYHLSQATSRVTRAHRGIESAS